MKARMQLASLRRLYSGYRMRDTSLNAISFPKRAECTSLKRETYEELAFQLLVGGFTPIHSLTSRSSRSSMVWRRNITCAPDSLTATTAGMSA